jgi:hypothetical protein
MIEEMTSKIDEYLDKFVSSELTLVKVKEEKYPINNLKRLFLERIKERDISNVISYIFLGELYLEKLETSGL